MRIRILAIVAALASIAGVCHAQNVRWDLPVTTTQAQGGNLLPVYAVPGAIVSFYSCTSGVCSTLANTYNSATSATPCPTGSQVVLNGSSACVSSADPYGNMGSWFQGGQYMATITARGSTYNYYFTIAGGSGGGVTSINVPGSSGIAGAVVFACGSGITCTQSGQTITLTTATAFTINSFTGCGGSLELGASITNPTCVATYSTTPASGQITNTDGVSSPTAITPANPSSTVISGTFTHSTTNTTTVTLTAIGSSTQVATQQYTWKSRIFGGVAATGATSSVTSSGTTAILSNSGVLTTIQLGSETVGQTLGSYTPSGQNIYLLLTGGSHTFTDNCTGFPFAFNAATSVSFVNANGVTVPMYLYSSTNPLTYTTGCAFTPKVAS